MFLIIDGHNLIPKIPGLNLSDLDDEPRLAEMIREYCRRKRARAELFFDGGLPGFAQPAKGGAVHIHVITKSSTADRAIIDFFMQKGHNSRNYTLVSSDHYVQNQSRNLGATVISSEQFAQELTQTLLQPEARSNSGAEHPLSKAEVDEWLEIFAKEKKKPEQKS
jgi:predicted RNA-binding protein with PIN domain